MNDLVQQARMLANSPVMNRETVRKTLLECADEIENLVNQIAEITMRLEKTYER